MKKTNLWLSALTVFAGTAFSWAGEPSNGIRSTPGYTTHVGDLPDGSATPLAAVSDEQAWGSNEPSLTQVSHRTSNQYNKPVGFRRPSAMRQTATCDDCGPSGCDDCGPIGCDDCGPSGCDVMYDNSCDSMPGGRHRSLFSSGTRAKRGTWGRIEALLWWAQDRDAPALISTAPAGVLPAVPMLGTPAFGGKGGLDAGLLAGNRADFGRYFGSNESLGLGGRVYGFWNGGMSSSYSSDGSGDSVGVPFFDVADPFATGVAVGNFGVLPIGLNQGLGTIYTGDVSAESDMNFIGAEAYGRVSMMKNASARVDLLGGYTFHSFDDSISLSGTSVQNNIVAGTMTPQNTFSFRDAYGAKNRFNGGQIGFESQLCKGRWTFSSLTKVHLGNMNQRVNIQGHSSFTDNNVNTTATSNSRGLLVQGNGGSYERDVFTFVPEANIKLGYRLGRHTTFNVGYTFMLWSDLALAGNHIDNRIDSQRVYPTDPAEDLRTTVPGFAWNTQSFYLHGLDLGLTFTF